MRTPVALIAAVSVLAGLLLAPAPPTADRVRMTKLSADQVWSANQWHTVASIPIKAGSPVSVGVQLPLRQLDSSKPASHVQLVMVRMPRRDGTGNLTTAWPTGLRKGTLMQLTHWHTVAGFSGRMTVRAYISDPDGGRYGVPYRIVKARQR